MAATTTPRRLLATAAILFAAFEGNLLYQYAYRSENLLHADLPSFWVAAKLAFADAPLPVRLRRDARPRRRGRPSRLPVPLPATQPARALPAAAHHLAGGGDAGGRGEPPARSRLHRPACSSCCDGRATRRRSPCSECSWARACSPGFPSSTRWCTVSRTCSFSSCCARPGSAFATTASARRGWCSRSRSWSSRRPRSFCSTWRRGGRGARSAPAWRRSPSPRPRLSRAPERTVANVAARGAALTRLRPPAAPSLLARLPVEPEPQRAGVPLLPRARLPAHRRAAADRRPRAGLRPRDRRSRALALRGPSSAGRAAPPSIEAADLGFCLFLATMFLVGSLSWEHHLVFAMPGLALLLLSALRQPRGAGELVGLAACVPGILVTLPLNHPSLHHGWAQVLVSIRTYAVIVLWSMLWRRLRAREPSKVEKFVVYK